MLHAECEQIVMSYREYLLLQVDRVLVVFKREPNVERCIDFIVKFVTAINAESGMRVLV